MDVLLETSRTTLVTPTASVPWFHVNVNDERLTAEVDTWVGAVGEVTSTAAAVIACWLKEFADVFPAASLALILHV